MPPLDLTIDELLTTTRSVRKRLPSRTDCNHGRHPCQMDVYLIGCSFVIYLEPRDQYCILRVKRCNYASIPLPQPKRKNHARHHKSEKALQQCRRYHCYKTAFPCARKFQASDASPFWLL